MRLHWRAPDPRCEEHDLRQFSCACGIQIADRVDRDANQS
jgi:hypothetical protein